MTQNHNHLHPDNQVKAPRPQLGSLRPCVSPFAARNDFMLNFHVARPSAQEGHILTPKDI